MEQTDKNDAPLCNPSVSNAQGIQIQEETDDDISSTEIALQTQALDLNSTGSSSPGAKPNRLTSIITNELRIPSDMSSSQIPLILISRATSQLYNPPINSVTLKFKNISPEPTYQFKTFSNLPSAVSLAISPHNQPPSLFLQALSKLNESSLSFAIINHTNALPNVNSANLNLTKTITIANKASELSPPDSLTSAPPSYSFVLRQIAQRRRPRLMGTFIPSPSFIQHTPPPNYAAAFDIYVDNPVPPVPPTIFDFGFTAMPAVCPECGYIGLTLIQSRTTMCTHMCALFMCVFCCWICAPLPYILRSCKDVFHYCRNCRHFLGMYCPSNPDSVYRPPPPPEPENPPTSIFRRM